MVKTSTLAVILAALIISVVFTAEADGAGLVKRAISTVGTWAVSDIPQLPATKIDLADGNIIVGSGTTGLSVNPSGAVDVSNTGVFSIPNIHSIVNVTSTGCAAGQILKVSGTTWQCAADDNSGSSAFTNIASMPQTTATILANNNTVANSAVFKTLTQGTDIVLTNGSQAITIAADIANIHTINNVTSTGCAAGQILKVSGTTWQCAADDNSGSSAFTNITPIGTTASSGNATLIHTNSTNSGVFKNISAINGTSITNGTSELIISNTYINALKANLTSSLGATEYTQIFRIPLTANSANSISGLITYTTSSTTIGTQFTANVTNANTHGGCSFREYTSATAEAIDRFSMNSSNPTIDTASTAPFPAVANNAMHTDFQCGLVTASTPGDLRIFFQSETAGSAVNVKAGSYYIKTP